ncbi:MAG: hypothetical protein ABFS86_01455 [Planctomycetota bacterium]
MDRPRELTKTEKFLGIVPGDVVSFVGGGGKSMLMHSIAARLAKEDRRVVCAATRDFRPAPGESPYRFLTDERPFGELMPNLQEHGTVTVAAERLEDGMLKGYRPDEIDTFTDLADYVFVEAEDAGGASLPEPVTTPRPIPRLTTVVCAVAGLDALGPDLDCAAFAEVLTDAGGILRCFPAARRIVLMLNKADRHPVRLDGARVAKLAKDDLGGEGPPVHVLLTSVKDYMKRV